MNKLETCVFIVSEILHGLSQELEFVLRRSLTFWNSELPSVSLNIA